MGRGKWVKVLLMFLVCTLISIAILSLHMKFSGGLNKSPSTVSGMFFTLLILAVPFHLVELVLIYIIYYFVIKSVSARINRAGLMVFMLVFGFVYLYLIQAFLGGVIGDVEKYSFFDSFKRLNYFYFYLTVVYMIQINLSFLMARKQP